MTKNEIIKAIASRREVERIVNSTCGKAISDLSQMIYEVLMRMSESRLQELHRSNQLGYYIMGIARKQYYSGKSAYHNQQRRQPDKNRLQYAV